MKQARIWSVAFILIAASPSFAGEACEHDELAGALDALKRFDAGDRPSIVLGTVGQSCPGIPIGLTRALGDAAHAARSDWPTILGAAANKEEAQSAFEAVCPGWSDLPFANSFATEAPSGLFETCKFSRLGVCTATEFRAAEVHLVTMALVVYKVLSDDGVTPDLARRLARAVIVPGEIRTEKRPPKKKSK